MKYLVFLLLFFISINATSQVMQITGGAGGNKFRALKADSFLVVPKGTDTANLANPKWGESTTGALFVKTTDSTLWFKVGGQWVQAGGNFTQTVIGNDTTIYEFVIDSTGAAANRVLFAGAKKIRSDSHFLWDSVNNKLVINHFNHSIGGVNTKLYVNGNANLNGSATSQQFRVSQIQQVFNDTTNYKPVIVNSSGDLYKLDRWPSGGGGSGTVTSISQGYGIINSTNPITTTGTQRIDTFAISTRAWRDKLADSLGAIIATKGSGTVTNFSAGDLSPLFTTSEATTTTTPALSFSLSNAGSYTVFGNQTNASAAPSFAKLNINTIDATGTPSATTYLRGDGSWQSVSGGSGVPSDSLSFRRVGGTALAGLVNTISHHTVYNGNVGKGNAATSQDSANFFWGARAGLASTSGYRNIAIGRGALKSITTTNFAIAIGDSAASTVSASPNAPIAIGANALRSYTGTGSTANDGPVAIGYDALAAHTTTNSVLYISNVAVGYRALSATTSGEANVAIGSSAAIGNTTGGANFAIGANSLRNNQTGSNNVAIGYLALGDGGTASSQNVAIGGIALRASGSSSNLTQNTAVGYGAMTGGATTSAANNVAVGYNALSAITTGQYNIAIGGFNQGSTITQGTRNIVIAGTGAGNVTTGRGNVMIGDQPSVVSATANGQISITNVFNRSAGRIYINTQTNEAPSVPTFTTGLAFEVGGATDGAARIQPVTTAQRNAITGAANAFISNTELDIDNDHNGTTWTVNDGVIFTQTADKNINTTAAETTLFGTGSGTLTIPASYLYSGNTITIKIWGYMTTNGTPTLDIKFKLGSTTICSTGATTLVSVASNGMFVAECILTARASPGAAAAIMGQGEFEYYSAATTKNSVRAMNTATVNAATNGSLAVDVTATWGTSDANNKIVATNAEVTIKN